MMLASPRGRVLFPLLALAFTAGVVPTGAALAQQAATLPLGPGTRVRVTSPKLVAPLIANFLQMRGDTAVFIEDAAGRGIWSLQVSDITRIDRSDGERKANRPYIMRGALVGAAAGAGAGLAFSAIAKPSDTSKKYNRGLSAGAGAAVGAIVGGAVGTRFGSERWTSVPLPRRMAVVPGRHGFGVHLGFDF